MDEKLLIELIEEAQKRGGGLILNMGDTPRAVVLSVDAYTELLSGKSSDLLAPASAATTEPLAEKEKPMTVLVTGGAGYIGGHVVREALAQGYSVVVLDNLSTGKREHVPSGAVFIEGDVRDVNLLRDIFAQYAITVVVHLAALLEAQESVAQPVPYFETNVLATMRLVEVMHEVGVHKLLFASTAAVYGASNVGNFTESSPCAPTNPYGSSKLLAEQGLEYFATYAGITVTVLRFFNVAGTHEAWGIHDTHDRAHLIPLVLDVAKGKSSQLTVFGEDYETVDGTCVRDYVHVYDIARAILAAATIPQSDSYEVYNVGTGHGASVREIVQVVAEITGRMVPMEVGPRRAGDDAQRVADASKIKQALGFATLHSSLAEIIESAWESVAESAGM